MEERRMIMITHENGNREFCYLERVGYKSNFIIGSIGFNAAEGDWKQAREYLDAQLEREPNNKIQQLEQENKELKEKLRKANHVLYKIEVAPLKGIMFELASQYNMDNMEPPKEGD